jgi:hypothetical protein
MSTGVRWLASAWMSSNPAVATTVAVVTDPVGAVTGYAKELTNLMIGPAGRLSNAVVTPVVVGAITGKPVSIDKEEVKSVAIELALTLVSEGQGRLSGARVRAIEARTIAETETSASAEPAARFVVTENGVAVPTDAAELTANLQSLDEVATADPNKSRKFVGTDYQGPLRVRIEKAHPETPGYTGPIDPLHTVDHLHIDRRVNGASGPFKSREKIPYDWPFRPFR